MEILLYTVIIILLLLTAFFISKLSHSQKELKQLKESSTLQLSISEAHLQTVEKEKTFLIQQLLSDKRNLNEELNRLNEINRDLIGERERYKSYIENQQEKIDEQKEQIVSLHERLNKDFEILANRILEEKSNKFTELNKLNLDQILKPLKENIKAFEDKVERAYKSESTERNILQGELNKLMQLNKQISDEANNLSKALKADTKKQGNWGEVVLDRVLEASGLIEGESYNKQVALLNDDNSRMQPDVVVYLPEQKHLIIDSKVSLVAYNNAVNTDSDEQRLIYLNEHVSSVKAHIKNLSAKNYPALKGIQSPDFVLLFMPLESSFSLAVQHDAEIFEFAWNRKIVIVSPSTLLATLKTIASVWRHERQTKNAIEIATRAGQLYDKFSLFTNDIKKIGEHLEKARNAYSDAYSKLSTGQGNLMARVENLKKMGAKASKQLENIDYELPEELQ